ncbi:MOSC domain-containing protein [Humisphaera borealis]|uniref:MOSC domain-containing protein n=1 Tax=Humisphaera borealis TaxID=2807512 RepID=A0A7M2WU17_9BACT|nr:MOSC domain-containing protein [Humisphaera borealis]QOV88030.1 MOSC domain-containing protein [Humisphaera borealis]
MSAVASIFIAPTAKAAMVPVSSVEAIAGEGLAGDRYQLGIGAFSRWPGEGRQITLIASEAIGDILAETGIDLSDGRHRRNVVTVGVALEELLERRFHLGTLLLRGQRLCAPCRYLDGLVGEPVFAAMKGRGGLRAEIIVGGTIHIGDVISAA